MIEAELISWMLNLFKGKEDSCGSITSGGTESIFTAVYTVREYARNEMNIFKPEIICSESCHPAWVKACYYLDVKVKMVKIDKSTGLASFSEMTKKITS